MSKFKYSYTKGGNYLLPLVPVILKNGNTKLQTGYIALVDSGAVFSVFHSEVALTLGIELAKIKKRVMFRGVGKKGKDFKGIPYVVTLMVSQKGKSYEFDTVIVFSDDIDKDGHSLLGMGGFIDKFSSLIFDNKYKRVILEK